MTDIAETAETAPDPDKIFYIASQNSDSTEGRGQTIPIGFFTNVEDAVKAVKNRGVMGVGDGDVYYAVLDAPYVHMFTRSRLVYDGNMRVGGKIEGGYTKMFSEATGIDPEYFEYLALKKKFEGR
jgi:hypothetical protein